MQALQATSSLTIFKYSFSPYLSISACFFAFFFAFLSARSSSVPSDLSTTEWIDFGPVTAGAFGALSRTQQQQQGHSFTRDRRHLRQPVRLAFCGRSWETTRGGSEEWHRRGVEGGEDEGGRRGRRAVEGVEGVGEIGCREDVCA